MKQKVIVCQANEAEKKIQPLLDQGYTVEFCVAEHLTSTDSTQPGTYGAKGYSITAGDIVFILKNNIKHDNY